MKQKNRLVLLLIVAMFVLQSGGRAAEDKSDFFGIKKFVQKGIPANPPKKKTKGIPAGASAKAADKTDKKENDSELTEEEKKMVKEMAEKEPKDKGDVSEAQPKENVKLPAGVGATAPPKIIVTAPKGPALPPKNPNDFIIRVPQAPSRVPQNPNGLTAPSPPPTPGIKKKP